MADLPRMYGALASWWPLLSPPADYVEEATLYVDAIEQLTRRPVRCVLELGSGGGNNASHMKRRFEMTLVDLSPEMLEVSRVLNPECEHVAGDMRTIRLDRRFDAVFVHDAVMYLTEEEDLRAAIHTAAAHLEPGGVALFVPDATTESYHPETEAGGTDGDGRSMRYLQWSRPATGTTFSTTFVYVLREGDDPPIVTWEDHVTGLFPRQRWLDLITEAGLEARALPYPHSSFNEPQEMFAGVSASRPGTRGR
jgi:SAM-dependent methyltransferase